MGQDWIKENMVYSTKYVVTVESLRIDETRVSKKILESQECTIMIRNECVSCNSRCEQTMCKRWIGWGFAMMRDLNQMGYISRLKMCDGATLQRGLAQHIIMIRVEVSRVEENARTRRRLIDHLRSRQRRATLVSRHP